MDANTDTNKQAPHTAVILWLKDRLKGATIDEVEAATGVGARAVRQILTALATMGMATDKGTAWTVSAFADPNVVPVKVVDRSRVKERKKAQKKREKTAVEHSTVWDTFLASAKTVALTMPEFTTDDVRREFDKTGSFGNIEPRISGPIMVKAQKLGYCKPINKRQISDRRQSGHTQVYRSLICESGCLPDDPLDMMTTEEMREEILRLREELARVLTANAAE